jgi:hypothetical protein
VERKCCGDVSKRGSDDCNKPIHFYQKKELDKIIEILSTKLQELDEAKEVLYDNLLELGEKGRNHYE